MKPEYTRCAFLDVVDPIRVLLDEFFPSTLQTTLRLLRLAPPAYGMLFKSTVLPVFQMSGNVTTDTSKGAHAAHRPSRDLMHYYQRIACSLAVELLQKLVKGIVVALYACVGFGEQVLE